MKPNYITALKYDWLTPLYDLLIEKFLREKTFKQGLISLVDKEPTNVLDIGCGTATLSTMIKRRFPNTDIVGLDGDPKILELAKRKIEGEGLDIRFIQGMSFNLPFPDNSFDLVVSSLMFHHLSSADKKRTAMEIHRVLKPGGELKVADWGKAPDALMRVAFLTVQFLDGFKTTQENIKGMLPQYFKSVGFHDFIESKQYRTILGSISIYEATVA